MKRLFCICIACCLLLTGCQQTLIREDTMADRMLNENGQTIRLPQVDPAMGMEMQMQVILYFLLEGENLLVPSYRTLSVGSREDAARLLFDALAAGPLKEEAGTAPTLPPGTSALAAGPEEENVATIVPILPPGTRALEIRRTDDLITITLSRVFLDAGIAGTTHEERLLFQKLCVYAVINSLCSLEGVRRVQILVDSDGSGMGSKAPPFLLGFATGEIDTNLVEALPKDTSSLTATPQNIAGRTLGHIVNGDFEKAYALFAATDGSLPAFEEFALQFRSETVLTDYTVEGFAVREGGQNEIGLTLHWQTPDGTQLQTTAIISMRQENGYHKLVYASLLQAMQEEVGL